jgi:D-sedoheptulose 7-phosphate isomerase
MNMKEFVKKQLAESALVKIHLAESKQVDEIVTIAKTIVKAFRNNKKVLLFGNGGSAADAQHIAAEWVGRFYKDRKSLPAIALTTDSSIVTAIANDYGYENLFSRQIEGLSNRGDVAIGITTSGTSPNVLKAFAEAKRKGLITIGLTGEKGKVLAKKVDYCLVVPSEYTPRVQEGHITALHIICEIIEKELF